MAGEVFDFGADDADAAFVRGVEFEDAGAEEVRPEELFGEREDGAGFARARGAVEEEVRQVGVGEGALEEGCGVRLGGYVREGFGAAGGGVSGLNWVL